MKNNQPPAGGTMQGGSSIIKRFENLGSVHVSIKINMESLKVKK
jgi:hypothetical protein